MVIEIAKSEITLKELEELKRKFKVEIVEDSVLVFLN